MCLDGELVGMCWVDEQPEILFLLGLVVKSERQGLGLGTQALIWLERNCPEAVQAIELQVHGSNPRARALYERMGYQVILFDPGSQFYLMRKEFCQAHTKE